ncbi:uncharacterized protein [Amphiura filiformis]|uniref:uncharacterized protein n=1 Tax=Amphiura filiformis TaxID=82378 RepID=UPI003B21FA23
MGMPYDGATLKPTVDALHVYCLINVGARIIKTLYISTYVIMDNIVSSAIPPESINIELHFVDGATSNATSDASIVKQYDINYNPPVTSSNEASVSVEQLLAVIQEQEEDQGKKQMEVPQRDSQAAPGSFLEDDEDVPESLRRQYVCDKCGRVYRSRSGLDDHVSVVHEQSLHVCHICGATMKWKTNLKTHLRTVHNIGGPKRALVINRKCQECGTTFRSNVLLYHHLRKVHKVAKPIKCKVCSKTFSTVGPSWWDHKKMHPEVYPCYTCDVCQSRFSTLGGFKKHQLQSGHGNNVKGQVDVTTGRI